MLEPRSVSPSGATAASAADAEAARAHAIQHVWRVAAVALTLQRRAVASINAGNATPQSIDTATLHMGAALNSLIQAVRDLDAVLNAGEVPPSSNPNLC
jgi:hypothetical protein